VRIWSDPWIPRGCTRRPATPRGSSILSKVSELIDPHTDSWDEQLVRDTFWPEDAEEILRIPVNRDLQDWPAWHYDQAGIFSVKSAYKLAVQLLEQETGRDANSSNAAVLSDVQFKWHKIWQMKVPNKVKMFIWRFAHNSLPVRRNISRRGVKIDTVCPVCKRQDEDCGHLFFKCKGVRECWRLMGMENIRNALLHACSGKEVVQRIWDLNQELQFKVLILLWRWWSARNKANAEDKMASPGEVCSSVTYFLMEFKKLDSQQKQEKQKTQMKWKAPPADYYKLNIDASFDPKMRSGGWGYVARNSEGDFLDGGAGSIIRVFDVFQAEALAALHAVQRAAQLGMSRIILETDATNLGKALTTKELDRSANGSLFRQIRDLLINDFSFYMISVCPRTCNKVADKLAVYGANIVLPGSYEFLSQAPDFVSDLVSGDKHGDGV